MYDSSVRSATAGTGKTFLAIVAIFSLLLSAFAIARPVIAGHGDGEPEVTPTTEAFPGGDPTCDVEGAVAVRFEDEEVFAGSSKDVTLSDGSTATVTLVSISADNELTFEVEDGLAATVKVKGGPATQDDVNIYDYSSFPGGGIAHDDGLQTPTGSGISHVDFCLVPVEASIIVYKTDQTGADVADAEFTVFEGDTPVAGPMSTGSDGIVCFDGLSLDTDYTVVETDAPDGYLPADPDNQTTQATEGDCEDRAGADPDLTFTNTLLGSLLVLKTDDGDPAQGLEGAEFTITGPDDFETTDTSDADGWFCLNGLIFGEEYTVTETAAPDGYVIAGDNPQSHTIDDSATCEERVAGEPEADLVFVNEEEEAPTGSVTILKDIGECEICETATPGRWFNMSPGTDTTPGTEFANASLGSDPITVAGITFDEVSDVHDHAKPGSLLWHYLGLEMNVRWGTANDCDLASLVYDGAIEAFHGMTVGEILAAAEGFLNGADVGFTEQQLHDVVAEINESNTGDGTLVCPTETDGAAGANFEFELWLAANYPDGDGPEDSGTTDGSGELTFSGLEIGTEYLLVEVGGPDPDLTCMIVSAEGVELPVTFDEEAGTITFTLTEDVLDLTIEVSNECQEEEEEEFAVDLVKADQDENRLEAVTFELTGEGYLASDTSDGDGEIRFEGLLAGQVYTLTETDGLEDCETAGPWTVTVAEDGSISIVDAEDNAVDTTQGGAFLIVNVCEEEEELGELEIIKWFCPTEGDDVMFVIGPLTEEPVEFGIQGEEAEMPSEEGCTLGAESEEALGASFEINGGDLEDPLVVQTEWEEILFLDLPAGEYTITELGTGLSADFEIVVDGDTAVVVFNFLGEEEEEEGLLKILKFSCENEGDTAFVVVEGDAGLSDLSTLPGDCEDPSPDDATFTLTTGELTSAEFTLGDDGGRLIPLAVGSYVLNEVDPNEASSPSFAIANDATTTVVVFNFEGEGVAPEQEEEEEEQREGTQGGQLPNTSTAPGLTGSVPAALLALVMLTGLGAAGYAMKADARRRR